MTQQTMLDALTAEWEDVSGRLDPEQFTKLVALVAEMQEAEDADTSALITEDIAAMLGSLLPPTHPVRQALIEPESRFQRPDVNWQGLRTGLRDRLTGSAPVPDLGRFRRLEHHDERQLAEAGADPADPGLIRLPTEPGEGGSWPAFQFDASGQPRETVREVNRQLRAEQDPWGALDWWFGPNDRLGGVPADLLDQVAAEAILDAARDDAAEV